MDFKADTRLTEEEKAFMADWDKRGKLQVMPPSISIEQAHEVAMAAAQAAARVQQYSSTTIGAEIAQAYLQAYEAVEGWTKPSNRTQEQANLTGTIEREGDFFTLRVDGLRKHFISVVHDGSACSFHIPKDA